MVDLIELRDDIMREVYAEAEPPLDFDDLLENPDEYPDDWYDRHYLPADKEKEIFDKHTEDVTLTNSQHAELALTCITSMGPTSVPPEEWDEDE